MRIRRLACTGVFCLAATGLASATYQIAVGARDRRRYPPPGELVDIGGRRLHLWRAGEGRPAVVVAPSLAEPGHGWAEIQRRLAPYTSVVLYDRAGLGWSDPGPWPTGRQMVEDLHALLEAARIPPPYVLVGHSVGGLLMRLYTASHPEQVAALVLVDSSHPDQWRRLRGRRTTRRWRWRNVSRSALRLLAPARPTEIPAHLQRGLLPEVAVAAAAVQRQPKHRRAAVREMAAFSGLATEASLVLDGSPGALGQLPLVVISRVPASRGARLHGAARPQQGGRGDGGAQGGRC